MKVTLLLLKQFKLPFRVLIEALKDISQDVNIECDETGLKIVAMDVSYCISTFKIRS